MMEWMQAAVAALLGLFSPAPDQPARFYGYAEGEYVRLAPREGGTLRELRIRRGETAAAGQAVAVLEDGSERAALADARGRLAQAEAQLANLRKGRRTPEIEALEAQRTQAAAAMRLSEAQYRRQRQLPAGQVVSVDRIDQARAAFERDRARVAELAADLDLARMSARDDEIDAAGAAVEIARAGIEQAEWKLGQRTLSAPVAALAADTLFEPGEFVPAGGAVVSLLPPGNVKLRFYVPEAALSGMAIGMELAVGCDRCPAGLRARVSFVSPQAEFTPPVIYSRESRAKLVYLVEARPLAGASLNPGQPVELSRPSR
ncbi:HlyD family secretion protein [Stella humosa]|uniref:HlyD family secretion protein n=1 Tax=Stella humosa TaxID=94 RepID=A0A3N1MEI4_9PROT|nr:HlyD family efflux transporter periplasmic adaptor subunit [Stella humosa]ROQ01709.1 HlyD family secretion protein [Stella humosa]BBK32090.1 secretion protein HlyD [Stella humosa]